VRVGDLIKLKQYCRNSDRWAAIIEVPIGLECVKIMYFDTGEISTAVKSNVTVISKSGE